MPSLGRKVQPPLLPEIPADLEPRLRAILEALYEEIDLREGRQAKGTNSRFVSIEDLVDAGVIADGDIT